MSTHRTDLGDGGPGFDPRVQPLQPDRSLGELLGDMSSDVANLIRDELELAKLELKEEARRAGRSAAGFGAGGVAGLLAAMFVSFALAWLLDQGLNTALSFLIVGVLWAVAALVLMSSARQRMKDVDVLPVTTQTLKEDAQWLATQRN